MMKLQRRVFCVMLTALMLLALAPAMSEGMRTLSLPPQLTTIEEEAFFNDDSLTSVYIPDSVTAIGALAFAGCDQLTDVYFGTQSIAIAPDAFSGSGKVCLNVYLGTSAEAYAKAYDVPYRLLGTTGDFYSQLAGLVGQQDLSSSIVQSDEFATMRLIVRTDGSGLPDLSQYRLRQAIADKDNVYVLQFNNEADTEACYNALVQQIGRGYLFVEPDACISTGDDNASIAALGAEWMEDPMHFQEYADWLDKNGEGSAVVAVIDSGVGEASVLPRERVLAGVSTVDEQSPRQDGKRHGTSVAGIIAESTAGLPISILPIRVLNDGGVGTPSTIGGGIGYAIENGADVINLSMNFKRSAYVQMKIEEAISKGIKVVVAAGNSGTDCSGIYPANLEDCIVVSAIGPDMNRTGESNYGSTVDFCAPGEKLTCYMPGGGTATRHGTSFAAPYISAALAMLELDSRKLSLTDACEDLGAEGWDVNHGYGLPDLEKFAAWKVIRIDIEDTEPVIPINNYLTLRFNVLPENATDRSVTVTSSDSSIMRVVSYTNSMARLQAKSAGSAEITIAANDGSGVVAKRTFEVIVPVDSVTIHEANYNDIHTLRTGDKNNTVQLVAEILPENATNKEVEWSSSNTGVATVDQNGLVTSVDDGRTTITATARDGYGAKDTWQIEAVTKPAPLEVIVHASRETIPVGETEQLSAEVLPAEAEQAVTWSIISTNPAGIASISDNGLLSVSGKGTIIVGAKAENNVTGFGIFYGVKYPVSVSISGAESVRMGSTLALTATVLPEDADDRTVRWSTSTPSVATVNSSGVVTPVAPGTVTITATCNAKSDVTASKTILVNPATYTLTFNANGGSVSPTSRTAECNKAIGTLPTPTRTYYNFNGWYTAASGGTQVTASTTFAANTTIYAHWTEKPWSTNWVTASELPSGKYRTQSKTQYRYQDASYSAWSGWSDWVIDRQSTGELKREESATVYHWYRYVCPYCGTHMHVYNKCYTWAGGCGKTIGSDHWATTWLTTPPSGGTQNWEGTGRIMLGSSTKDRWFYWIDASQGYPNGRSETGYRYSTRTKSWGAWSGWSDTAMTSSTTRNVETRTVYRYQYE